MSNTHTERYGHKLSRSNPNRQVMHFILCHTRFSEDVEGIEVQLEDKCKQKCQKYVAF